MWHYISLWASGVWKVYPLAFCAVTLCKCTYFICYYRNESCDLTVINKAHIVTLRNRMDTIKKQFELSACVWWGQFSFCRNKKKKETNKQRARMWGFKNELLQLSNPVCVSLVQQNCVNEVRCLHTIEIAIKIRVVTCIGWTKWRGEPQRFLPAQHFLGQHVQKHKRVKGRQATRCSKHFFLFVYYAHHASFIH
jgi:hypothetical protein